MKARLAAATGRKGKQLFPLSTRKYATVVAKRLIRETNRKLSKGKTSVDINLRRKRP